MATDRSNGGDPTEWSFDVPASEVNLERLYSELSDRPFPFVYAYIIELKRKAPVTYWRFADWCREHDVLTSVKF